MAILEGLRLDSGTLVLVGWESTVPRLWLPTDISQPQWVTPTPAPGMFFFSLALFPKGRPLGDATAPPPTRGAQEGAL